MVHPVALTSAVSLRLVAPGDGDALAAATVRNRTHLAPWEPERGPDHATPAGQEAFIAEMLPQHAAGTALAFVLVHEDVIIGQATVSHVVRGPFLSGNLGYWLDAEWTGKGLMTSAVLSIADICRTRLGLHRLQAATLIHNAASQAVLIRAGFTRIGVARDYLKIAGRWQDHVIYQRILG